MIFPNNQGREDDKPSSPLQSVVNIVSFSWEGGQRCVVNMLYFFINFTKIFYFVLPDKDPKEREETPRK